MYYRIVLARPNLSVLELGTVPDEDAMGTWFSVAFSKGLLPNPPSYLDEIQVYEMEDCEDATDCGRPAFCDACSGGLLKWVWRLSWHQFEAKRIV